MGDNDIESPFGPLPTFPPHPSFNSRVGPTGIGVALGLSIVALIIIICLIKRACKCKCCKRKKPTLTEKALKKMGLQKSKRPFSVSGILDKK